MPTVSLDGLSFSGLAWTLDMLPSKHKEIGIWYCMTIKVMSRLNWS